MRSECFDIKVPFLNIVCSFKIPDQRHGTVIKYSWLCCVAEEWIWMENYKYLIPLILIWLNNLSITRLCTYVYTYWIMMMCAFITSIEWIEMYWLWMRIKKKMEILFYFYFFFRWIKGGKKKFNKVIPLQIQRIDEEGNIFNLIDSWWNKLMKYWISRVIRMSR